MVVAVLEELCYFILNADFFSLPFFFPGECILTSHSFASEEEWKFPVPKEKGVGVGFKKREKGKFLWLWFCIV